MNLLENNFAILKAGISDTKAELREYLDEASLLDIDEDKVRQAYSDLTNPKKRINSEVAWILQAKSSERAIIQKIKNNQINSLSEIQELTNEPLSICNIIATIIEKKYLPKTEFITWVAFLCRTYENIDTYEILDLINEKREDSGFNELDEVSDINDALEEQVRYYESVIKNSLNKFQSIILVEIITDLIDNLTYKGTNPLPALAEKMLNNYELAIQPFLDKEKENISKKLINLRTSINTNSSLKQSDLNKLLDTIKNISKITKPVQIARKTQGRKYDDLNKIFDIVFDDNVIKLCLEKENLTFLKTYFEELEKVFVNVDEIIKIIKNNKTSLNEAIKNQKYVQINKEIKSVVSSLRASYFYKKNELINLIEKAARIEKSRQMGIVVANSIRDDNYGKLIEICAENNELQILKSINDALLTNFGFIAELRNSLIEENKAISQIQSQISLNKASAFGLVGLLTYGSYKATTATGSLLFKGIKKGLKKIKEYK